MMTLLMDNCVIASEARQSRVERTTLDCRVATLLAMTEVR
jgi:hypothetical protein